MKIRNSIVYPVLGMILFAALASAGIMAAIQHQSLQDLLLRVETDRLEAAERAVRSHVRLETTRLKGLARTLAENQSLARELSRSLDTGDIAPLRAAVASARADASLDLLQFGDPDGRVIYRASAGHEEVPDDLLQGVPRPKDDRTLILAARLKRAHALLAVTPIRDGNRTLGAVVAGTLLDNAFARSLARKTDAEIGLITPEGLIARSTRAEKNAGFDTDTARALLTSGAEAPRTIHAETTLTRYLPLQVADETVVLAIMLDISQVAQSVENNHVRILRSLLAVFLVALTLGAAFSAYLIRPLTRLRTRVADTARELSGSLDEPARGDEITGLVKSFDSLTDVVRFHVMRTETEQEELERKVGERTAELETALKAKSEFLARVSHEVRTPLHGVIGVAEMGLETAVTQSQKQYHKSILQEAGALLEVIDDILEYSKIEAGKVSMRPTAFDLFHLVEDLSESTAVRARRKGIRFHSFVSPDVPLRLVGPPGRLRQVLANLLSNALKFTHEGEVSLEVDVEESGRDHVVLRFSVRDTGIGIPEDQQAAIFESFTQADGSDSRRYGGTGLGTTIARQLVALMGGEIGLESKEGEGSLFWFTVRLDTQLAPWLDGSRFATDADHEADPLEEQRSLRILLVEDYPTNQLVATRHLSKAGHEVHLAVDGEKALDMFSRMRFDLVLMDVQMPRMDGYDTTRAIREMERVRAEQSGKPLIRTPIVAQTAHAPDEAWRKCEEAGMDGYLVKPIRRVDLLAEVGKWAGASPVHIPVAKKPAPIPRSPMDYPRALSEFEDDEPFLHEALAGFLDHVTGQLDILPGLLATGNFDTAGEEAHSIKGGASNLTATDLAAAALALQKACDTLDDNAALRALEGLTEQFTRFKKFAGQLLEDGLANSGR